VIVLVFFALAYASSWWPSFFSAGGIFPFGPLLAVIAVIIATTGKAGMREWWGRVVRWRGPMRWYVTALALPVAINVAAAALAVALGAPYPTAQQLGQWPHLVLTFFS